MLSQLQERQCPEDDPNLLHPAFHEFSQFLLILLCDINSKRPVTTVLN